MQRSHSVRLSVIIPLFNDADYIAVQLNALANQNWSEPWELIVSDNGSTDGSLRVVEQYRKRFPKLRIVDSSDMRGAAHARNAGAAAASSDNLAFCDADDEVAPGWLKAMGEALLMYDAVGGPRNIIKYSKPEVIKALSRSDWNPEKELCKFVSPPFLPYAASSNLGVKNTLHRDIGGFDETLGSLEDIDYSWRIQLSGKKIQFIDNAVLYYRLPSTLRGCLRKQYYSGQYQIALCKKYIPLGMPELSWHTDMSNWIQTLRGIRQISVEKEDRYRWLMHFAFLSGRLKGHFKYRV
jgi:glycosyltransferase involved in cell wall biosynthesis